MICEMNSHSSYPFSNNSHLGSHKVFHQQKFLIRLFVIALLIFVMSSLSVYAVEVNQECANKELAKAAADGNITPAELAIIANLCAITGGAQANELNGVVQEPVQPKGQEQIDAENHIAGGGRGDPSFIPGQHPECNIFAAGDRLIIRDATGKVLFNIERGTNSQFANSARFTRLTTSTNLLRELDEGRATILGDPNDFPIFFFGRKMDSSNKVNVSVDIEFEPVTLLPGITHVPTKAAGELVRIRITCQRKDGSKTLVTVLNGWNGLGNSTFQVDIPEEDPEELRDGESIQ